MLPVPLSLATHIRARVLRTKVIPQQLARDGCAQFSPIFQRVMVVKTSIDSHPEHLVDKVARILKRVGMDAVLKRNAIRHEMNFRGAKVGPQQCCDGSAGAGMRRWIFRVIRRRRQRQPC